MAADMGGLPSTPSRLLLDTTFQFATSSYNITVPELKRGQSWFFELWVPASATGFINIYINGDTTATNYYTQAAQSVSTSASLARVNESRFMITDANSSYAQGNISLGMDGKLFVQSDTVANSGSGMYAYDTWITNVGTFASITTLTFATSVANIIVAGSRFKLYAR